MRVFTAAALVLWSITVLASAQTAGQTAATPGQGGSPTASPSTAAVSPPPPATAPAASSTNAASAAAPPTGAASAGPSGNTLSSLERAFQSADLAGKLSILRSVASKSTPSMGPLYQMAVDYLTANLPVLHSQAQAQELAVVAAHLIGSSGYAKAAESTWELFQLSDAVAVRLAAADALAIVAKGNGDVINKMNHWLAGQNLLHLTGASVDPGVIDGCVRALAALEDPTSFQVLFTTMEAGYGEPVANDAKNAIHLLKGDRAKQWLQVVTSSRYADRPAALEMAMGDRNLSVAQKARIAVAPLEGALSPANALPSDSVSIEALRFHAVESLGKLQWTPSAGLVTTNFNRAAAEYQSGAISANDVVLSVDALAAMSTHEAAVRLSLYLGMINSRTENGRHFDRQITLAVVQGLGRLGDSVAYDNLSAMQYLDYPQSVKEAATQAVRDLTTS